MEDKEGNKLNYCPDCGHPVSFKAKFLYRIKSFIITFGVMGFTIFIFGTILLVKSPDEPLNFVNYMVSVYLNSIPEYGFDEQLKATAMSITNNSSGDFETMVTLKEWVNKNIKYSSDPVRDFLRTPKDTLRLGYGDCDDFSTLYCSLARQQGLACKVTCNGFHCWTIVETNDNRVWKVDPTWNTFEILQNVQEEN